MGDMSGTIVGDHRATVRSAREGDAELGGAARFLPGSLGSAVVREAPWDALVVR
jgi:hypothetical protein